MTDSHLEMMAMCKAAGKPKTPSIIKTAISSLKHEKKPEDVVVVVKNHKPKVGPRPPATPAAPFIITPPRRGPKPLGKIVLTGDKGKFSTRLEFIVDQSVLRNITSLAKYADSYEQFRILPRGNSWYAYGNMDALNLTFLNGHQLTGANEKLNNGDIIQLKGKASGKIVELAKVEIV